MLPLKKKCVSVCVYINRYSFPIVMKFGFSRHIFEKYSNMKFDENPSLISRVFPRGGRTDMTKLIDAFRNFAKSA